MLRSNKFYSLFATFFREHRVFREETITGVYELALIFLSD